MDFTNTLPQIAEGANAVEAINESFDAASPSMIYGRDPAGSSGLVWAWLGGRWGGNLVPNDSETLDASSTVYMVVSRTTGLPSFDTGDYDWENQDDFCRAYKITTNGSGVTTYEDHRAGPGGTVFGAGTGGGGGGSTTQCIPIACGDETTAITTGTAKVTFRMPYAMVLSSVKASLTTAQGSGSVLTVDINEAGSSILSTKITIDNTEKTSVTAATPAVISDASLADDAEITIDVDQIGTSGAAGLKVYLIGTV